MREWGLPEAPAAASLTELFCRGARRRVRDSFRSMWSHDDALKTAVGHEVLEGRYAWFEEGTAGLDAPAIQAGFERRRSATDPFPPKKVANR